MKKIGRTIKRRRKEAKTDYNVRFGLLKSEKARIVVRKTNKYVIGQIVISEGSQDKVLIQANSKELLSHGWPEKLEGSLKSLPASYLTGFLLGKKAGKIKEGILDIGLQRNVKKSRIYSLLKGLIDSGFEIKCDEKILPDESMLNKKPETGKLINAIKGKLNKHD